MVLDIILREKSNGQNGVLWLMKELSKKYGKETPFNDDVLIDEIVALTYAEVRNFFDDHVIGNTPIDYTKYLAKVGLATTRVDRQTGYFLDGEVPFIDVNEENGNTIFIRNGIGLNTFFKNLGVLGGDVIQSINGMPITLDSIRAIIGQSFGWTPDTIIKMAVLRDGETIHMEGVAGTPTVEVTKIIPVDRVSQDFSKLREAWLKE